MTQEAPVSSAKSETKLPYIPQGIKEVPFIEHIHEGGNVEKHTKSSSTVGYGTVLSVNKEEGTVKVIDVNGIKGKEDVWSISEVRSPK